MRRVITLSEHESLEIASEPLSSLGRDFFDSFDRYLEKTKGAKPLTVHRHHVRAGSLVGTVFYGGQQFEILPKLLGRSYENHKNSIYKNLLAILSFTKEIRIGITEVQKLGHSNGSLLEIYIGLFANSLLEEVTLRPNRGYVPVEENLNVLRGSIVFPRHISLNSFHQERLYCRFDEYSENNELNKLFKYVTCALHGITRVAETQSKLKRIELLLAEVADEVIGLDRARRIKLTRLNKGYELSLGLAQMFIAGLRPEPRAGQVNNLGIVFDMNRVFEEFIASLLKKYQSLLSFEVRSQKKMALTTRYRDIGDDEFTEGNSFGARSDIVITLADGSIVVIDTKYKKLDPLELASFKVPNADIFQIMTYASTLAKPNVKVLPVLLYPQPGSEVGDEIVRVFETSGTEKKCFLVMTVSLFEDLTSSSVREKLVERIISVCAESFQDI